MDGSARFSALIAAVLLAGCGSASGVDPAEFEETHALAYEAHRAASEAVEALAYGTGSGTTMGDELSAAETRIADLEALVADLQFEVSRLESRVEDACSQGDHVC